MNRNAMDEVIKCVNAVDALTEQIMLGTEMFVPAKQGYIGMDTLNYGQDEKLFVAVYRMENYHDTYGAVVISYTEMYGAQVIELEHIEKTGILSERAIKRVADKVLEYDHIDEIYEIRFPEVTLEGAAQL